MHLLEVRPGLGNLRFQLLNPVALLQHLHPLDPAFTGQGNDVVVDLLFRGQGAAQAIHALAQTLLTGLNRATFFVKTRGLQFELLLERFRPFFGHLRIEPNQGFTGADLLAFFYKDVLHHSSEGCLQRTLGPQRLQFSLGQDHLIDLGETSEDECK